MLWRKIFDDIQENVSASSEVSTLIAISGPPKVGKTYSMLACASRCFADSFLIDLANPQVRASFLEIRGNAERAISATEEDPSVILLKELLRVSQLSDLLEPPIRVDDQSSGLGTQPEDQQVPDGPISTRTAICLDSLECLRTKQEIEGFSQCIRLICKHLLKGDFACIMACESVAWPSVAKALSKYGRSAFPKAFDLGPLDFEEYCIARGLTRQFRDLEDRFNDFREGHTHDSLMQACTRYINFGGLPEAVTHSIQNRADEAAARKVHENVQKTITSSILALSGPINPQKQYKCWESIPKQLSRPSTTTKFLWKDVFEGGNAHKLKEGMDWLCEDGLITRISQVADGFTPLREAVQEQSFKAFPYDVGLLSSWLGTNASRDSLPTPAQRRGLVETYIAGQLLQNGIESYYWTDGSRASVSFVVEAADGVIPMQAIEGDSDSLSGLSKFMRLYGCPYGITVSNQDFRVDGNIVNIPLYAVCML